MQRNSLFPRLGGSPFTVLRDFHVEKWRPHFSLAICLCSHFHGALCIWRVTNQVRDSHPNACKHRESSSPTRHVSFPRHSAPPRACFLFPSRGLFLWNSQKKVDSSSHAFRAVWLMQIKGHAKLLWTLIMSNPSSSLMKMARTCSVLPLVLIFCQVTHFRMITCSLRGLEEGDLTSFIWICISFVHLPSGIWSDGKNESANRLISFWVCRC